MGKLAVISCESAKPKKAGDRLLGDRDGLFLRIRPHGTKTWFIEYMFGSTRRKYTIGVYDKAGANGESITEWLRAGRLSLTQARAIARMWKMARRAAHDPIAEWETQLADDQRGMRHTFLATTSICLHTDEARRVRQMGTAIVRRGG